MAQSHILYRKAPSRQQVMKGMQFYKSKQRVTCLTFTWPEVCSLWLRTAGSSGILKFLCGQMVRQHVFTKWVSSRVIRFWSCSSITYLMVRVALNSRGTSERVRKRGKRWLRPGHKHLNTHRHVTLTDSTLQGFIVQAVSQTVLS